MKQTSKLICLLLALLMVLSLAMTAFATTTSGKGTDNDGKITITNTVKETTYKIYRIFDLESFSDSTPNVHDDGAYSYKVNADWSGFFTPKTEGTEATNGRKYVNIDDNGYVTWIENASAADFAKDALAFATATGSTITTVGTQTTTEDNASVVFESLPLGYYLVDSSLGALCALTTTNKEATVTEKNANPSLDKKVNAGTTAAPDWKDQNDANIGDTVEFCATITVQGTARDYVLHDKMDDGLTTTDNPVTKVTLTVGSSTSTVETSKYSVKKNVSHDAETDTFDVEFTEDFCTSLASGNIIKVYYTATLNDNAVVNEEENNTAYLAYKDKNGISNETGKSSTKTFTWQIPVLKYQNGDTSEPLAGAKFTLYKTETVAGDGTKTYTDPVNFKKT